MNVPVRPDGKISAPLIDASLNAMGKDLTALARDIEKELAKFIRDPVVTVIVTSFVGPSEQIRVSWCSWQNQNSCLQAKDDHSRRDDRCRRDHRFC